MFYHQYSTGIASPGTMHPHHTSDGHLIVRSGDDCQHQGGRGLGSCVRVNQRESLINVVTTNKPKMLTGLGQQASGQVQVLLTHLA